MEFTWRLLAVLRHNERMACEIGNKIKRGVGQSHSSFFMLSKGKSAGVFCFRFNFFIKKVITYPQKYRELSTKVQVFVPICLKNCTWVQQENF